LILPPLLQKEKNKLFTHLRDFFSERGFLEVQTPILSPYVIPEMPIEVFSTHFVHPQKKKEELFLLPSPEYWMKQLLAQGYPSLFQIGPCFRNSESLGSWHNPEFTMVEWYALGMETQDNMELTWEMIQTLSGQWSLPKGWSQEPLILPMEEAFQKWAGISLSLCPDLESLRASASLQGLEYQEASTWEELFHYILIQKVEPSFPPERLIFLTAYPHQIPSLAAKSEDGLTAQRWELFYNGVELANCYKEETSLKEIQLFFEKETKEKEQALVPVQTNPHYPSILATMPRCSGVALGFDRLLALLLGKENIQGVIHFPFYDRVSGQ